MLSLSPFQITLTFVVLRHESFYLIVNIVYFMQFFHICYLKYSILQKSKSTPANQNYEQKFYTAKLC